MFSWGAMKYLLAMIGVFFLVVGVAHVFHLTPGPNTPGIPDPFAGF